MKDWRNPTPAEREHVEKAIRELAQSRAEISDYQVRTWASVTFAGSRHKMTVRFRGEEAVQAGELFLAILPEHEFAIPGQLVADAAIMRTTANSEYVGACIELLLLEDS